MILTTARPDHCSCRCDCSRVTGSDYDDHDDDDDDGVCQYARTITENEGVDSFVLPALCRPDAIKVMQRSNAATAAAAAAKTGFGRRAAGNKRDVLIRR